MKKLKRCNIKLDSVWVMLICTIIVVWVSAHITDTSLKLCYTLLDIPILLFVLQNLMQKKQENNNFNIDLYMKKNIENSVIWRSRTENSQDDIAYLCINNIGKIDIFSIYIKVTKHDGTIGWFEVREMLNVNKECVVCIPYKIPNIKEIAISCSIQTETRTKKFNGIQSGNDNMIIFSNSELFDAEKNAIYHEKGFKVFERLERFMV